MSRIERLTPREDGTITLKALQQALATLQSCPTTGRELVVSTVVVMGVQSSGKSSAIRRFLAGEEDPGEDVRAIVPSGKNCVTRTPVRYTCRAPTKDASGADDPFSTEAERYRLVGPERTSDDLAPISRDFSSGSSLQTTLQAIWSRIGEEVRGEASGDGSAPRSDGRQKPRASANGISLVDEIGVEIIKPGGSGVTLLDMPGVVTGLHVRLPDRRYLTTMPASGFFGRATGLFTSGKRQTETRFSNTDVAIIAREWTASLKSLGFGFGFGGDRKDQTTGELNGSPANEETRNQDGADGERNSESDSDAESDDGDTRSNETVRGLNTKKTPANGDDWNQKTGRTNAIRDACAAQPPPVLLIVTPFPVTGDATACAATEQLLLHAGSLSRNVLVLVNQADLCTSAESAHKLEEALPQWRDAYAAGRSRREDGPSGRDEDEDEDGDDGSDRQDEKITAAETTDAGGRFYGRLRVRPRDFIYEFSGTLRESERTEVRDGKDDYREATTRYHGRKVGETTKRGNHLAIAISAASLGRAAENDEVQRVKALLSQTFLDENRGIMFGLVQVQRWIDQCAFGSLDAGRLRRAAERFQRGYDSTKALLAVDPPVRLVDVWTRIGPALSDQYVHGHRASTDVACRLVEKLRAVCIREANSCGDGLAPPPVDRSPPSTCVPLPNAERSTQEHYGMGRLDTFLRSARGTAEDVATTSINIIRRWVERLLKENYPAKTALWTHVLNVCDVFFSNQGTEKQLITALEKHLVAAKYVVGRLENGATEDGLQSWIPPASSSSSGTPWNKTMPTSDRTPPRKQQLSDRETATPGGRISGIGNKRKQSTPTETNQNPPNPSKLRPKYRPDIVDATWYYYHADTAIRFLEPNFRAEVQQRIADLSGHICRELTRDSNLTIEEPPREGLESIRAQCCAYQDYLNSTQTLQTFLVEKGSGLVSRDYGV